MTARDDGGPAFPTIDSNGMTLRDWFAGNCPESWLDLMTPTTLGEVRDAMIDRNLIPPNRKDFDVTRSYTRKDRIDLYIALRYEYADAMVAARKGGAA